MSNAVFVPIIMGSASDLDHAKKIVATLDKLGIDSEMRIGSAHKTPDHVLEMLKHYEADPRPKVYITIAGRSNALSAFIDGQIQSPVIACPPVSSSFGGADIYSSLRMPSGVAPAVVIDPGGAAILAAKILSLAEPDIRNRLADLQTGYIETILQDDANLQKEQTTA